jgi:hypothetical protein
MHGREMRRVFWGNSEQKRLLGRHRQGDNILEAFVVVTMKNTGK